MARLTSKEKANIEKIKKEITSTILTLSKIQELNGIENQLLGLALEYITTAKRENYENRLLELNKYYYLLCGILYKHLDSKQIRFGTPQSVVIAPPHPSLQYTDREEAIGVMHEQDDDEYAF